MDTPGHVDFAYEVSRSLAACEGALLVVDAAQGVEAQTLANVYQSIEHDHEIVPVINKIDLPAADPRRSAQEIEEIIGLDACERRARLAPRPASASTKCSRRSSTRSRRPRATRGAPLKAMLVDSWYDPYLGVVILVRVIDGVDQARASRSSSWPAGTDHLVDRVGCFRPKIEQLQRARRRRDRLHHRADQGSRRDPRRRHHHRCASSPTRQGAARLQGSPAGGVLRPVPGRRRRFREAPRQPLQAAPQRRLASASRWRPAPRWASASAAASSACSTSRSSRSG